MTVLRVDWQALNATSAQIGMTAETFGRGRGLLDGMPLAVGATSEATALLERALDALSDALRKAETELQEVSSHLSATANRYQRTEQALAAWKVPG
ncbi:MAG: hypothetical protein ACRDOL_35690 [Streptosporangiaceae bacterium]